MFENLPLKNPIMFLWRNSPTIIIGKHQNPWKECRVQMLEKMGVKMARRKSGGGCVYHDMGNAVFSFINPMNMTDKLDYKTMNNDVIINALKNKYDLNTEANERNDIVIEHEGILKKISGSAYKFKLGNAASGEGRRSLYHGTMLLNAELGALGNYLNPTTAKITGKGVPSVKSKVVNLKQLNDKIEFNGFCDALEEEFMKKWDTGAGVNNRLLTVEELE